MSDLFATLPDKPDVRLMPPLIWGGIAGLAIAIIEIALFHTRLHSVNYFSFALCPTGLFFLSAEMDGSTRLVWLAAIVVCITNFFLWAGFIGVISAVVQKLLHLSHRQAD